MLRVLVASLFLLAGPAFAQTRAMPTLEGMGRSAEDEKLLEELSRAIEVYENESRDFLQAAQQLIQRKYDQKRGGLSLSYERMVRDLETLERKDRLDAIAQFEEFLQRYPREPRYAPDVMFRLGELYYERSADDHLLAMRLYEDQLRAQESQAPDKPAPPEPQVDFSPSIALYRRLLKEFPSYRLNDGAYYLLGYCLEKQNDFAQSQAAYLTLIDRYPKSRFTTEAWVRMGEYYFDAYSDSTALSKAASAYEKAVQDKNHPLYDKALYKLGWTYYRMDRFDEGVDAFLTLVEHYEDAAKKRGDPDAGGDLRGEALQYTAISLADESWGSLEKAQQLLQKRKSHRYEAEVFRRLGDVYFDQTRHDDAIAAYRLVLAKEPLSPDAPRVQRRIVEALEREQRLAESSAEAQRLGALYAPGSAWYRSNQRNAEALSGAQSLAEQSLYSSALFHHQQGLAFKKEGKADQARTSFETAAQGYKSYLELFPRSKSAYEMEFYYAECLYNTQQFVPAGSTYERVRDSTQGGKFRADAAFSAVLAYQQAVGTKKPLRSAERPEGQAVQKTALSPAEKSLVVASDVFARLRPTDERTPQVAFKAAELFYVHDDFTEARTRFERIVRDYPKSPVAQFATNLIVESHLTEKDWGAVEDVATRLSENRDVIVPSSELYKDLLKFKLAARFKRADELMRKGDYDQAAQKYLALVQEEPRHEFADKALNNAAVANEKTRRFDSALKLYERVFREYPNSKLADSALFRVAVNAENSYDFEKAVTSYQKLVQTYPASKEREAALYNAARLLEGQQRYGEAAAAFLRYTELFPDVEDAPKNHFRAALIYEKKKDWPAQIRTLEDFHKKYSGRKDQAELVVDAKKRVGDALARMGKEADARKAYEAAAAEFDKRQLQPESHPLAADSAAQARFRMAEYELKGFDALKIGGRGAALEQSFERKRAGVKRVNEAYAEVFKYKRLEWTLAALYRRGYALERFAATIIETPVPPEVKRLGDDAVIQYQDLLAQQTTALEDKAVESYTATLAEARKGRISNEWIQRTLESLNHFRPKEFPLLKEPKRSLAAEGSYPDALVGSLNGPVRGQP